MGFPQMQTASPLHDGTPSSRGESSRQRLQSFCGSEDRQCAKRESDWRRERERRKFKFGREKLGYVGVGSEHVVGCLDET